MIVRVISAAAMLCLLAADAPKGPEVPELNQKVLQYARDNLGKKIGDGECATLAAEALRTAGAKRMTTSPAGEYIWGELVRTVTPRENVTGAVQPGDLLQFRDAVVTGRVGRNTITWTYSHHTAIVAEVKKDGAVVEILHQNTGFARGGDEERRKVQRNSLDFTGLKRGWVKIYRPLPKE